MIYLDANFFVIYNFDKTVKGEKARKILEEIIAGKEAITSSLALDEVMWVIVKNKKIEALRETIEDIYAIPYLTVKEVGSDIPLEALDFIEKYSLKPRDAFHAAIMKSFHVKEIVSDDPDFDGVEWIKRIKI
ncbi:MAG: type II toxin-antitoxin system VapC family toxin [archaeon]|nr:type II toxin-antitoxin system VapC family toxin [archaeon]MCP8314543.1 type II toxin-antitoxin system VapC family toxin [archaeon]